MNNFQENLPVIIYPHNQRLMSGRVNDIVIMKTCHALARLGHRVGIITGKPAMNLSIEEYYGLQPLSNLQIIKVPMLRGKHFSWHGIFNLFCLLKILKMRKKGLADIIYLREIKLARFLLKFKKFIRLPFIIEVHDLRIRKFYDNLPEKNPDEEWVFKRVDAIIVLLNCFGDILKETYTIEVPVFKVPLAAERASFKIKENNNKTIGYIGQLYPLQGVEILIEAISYLPDVKLEIIGGSEKDIIRLKKLATSLNVNERINFLGFVKPQKVAEISDNIDILVICALNKGKRSYSAHTKLYEYMAMGKPVVAFDLPSVKEEIVDGIDVLLAKPGDPRDLADKIAYLLNNQDKAKSLAINAYKSSEKFTWENRAKKLSKIFNKIKYD